MDVNAEDLRQRQMVIRDRVSMAPTEVKDQPSVPHMCACFPPLSFTLLQIEASSASQRACGDKEFALNVLALPKSRDDWQDCELESVAWAPGVLSDGGVAKLVGAFFVHLLNM